MDKVIGLEIRKADQVVFTATVLGVALATNIYRMIMYHLMTDEATAELIKGRADMLTNQGWVPLLVKRGDSLLTIDDLAFGGLVDNVIGIFTPTEVSQNAVTI